jgi:hypothetical protein
MYPRHRNKKNIFSRPVFGFIILGIITLVIFSAGLYHLRSDEWKEKTQIINTSSAPLNNLSSEILSREATIVSLSSGLEIGLATRGTENGIFYHTIKVALPAIDREKEFYEGWLLCQSPYDFFSTGEMVTDADGDFVLEWAGARDDIDDYNQIVITRESRDNNAAPGERVAEGGW